MTSRLVLAAAILLVMAAPSLATDEQLPAAAGPVTMLVEAGLDGYVDPETPISVSVELAASALTVGRLELEFGGTVTTSVEIPAGSVKRYDLGGPPPLNRRQLTVRLLDADGVQLTSEAIRLRTATDEVLVGVAGSTGIDTALRSARSTPLENEISVLAVGPDDAARLAPLSYVITGPGGLADFDADDLAMLKRWVEDGGRLYGPSEEIARLDASGAGVAYGVTDLVVSRVGGGEVGTLAAPSNVSVDEWSRILRDRPGSGIVDQARQDASFALVSAASASQEASVPALPWLLAGIVVFVLLVGPVNFVVLRSISKPELAWVTVPILSLVFLGGFWVIGRSQLADFSATHAAVAIDRGGGTTSRAGVVVQVESAGEHLMGLPDGWRAIPTSRSLGGLASGDVSDDGVTFALEDLGVGTVELAWEEDDVPLATTATTTTLPSGAEGIEVEVTNESPWTMWSWGVIVNGFGYNGTEELAPGASGTLVIRSLLVRPGYEPAISEAVARRPYDPDKPAPSYDVVYPLALFAEQEAPRLRDRGAFVFGLTDDRNLDVVLDGRIAAASGTSLLVKGFVLPDDFARALGGVRPEVLAITGASSVERYGDEIYAYGADEVFFHYEVPVGAPAQAEISPSFTALDDVSVYDWLSGEFVPFAWGERFTVADLASASGEVVVRASVPPDAEQFFDESITIGRFAMRWSDA